MAIDIAIGPLRASEVDVADRIFRLAFGTRLGLPDPLRFGGDAAMVRTRHRAGHISALGAQGGGELVGSSFATNWGSVGIYGPLSVRPDLWDKGIGKRLVEASMETLVQWDNKHMGLFTIAESPKHLGLYQKFGFWPRFLTAIMAKPVTSARSGGQWSRYSEVPETERPKCTAACREVASSLYEGLDLSGEVRSVAAQGLGDTLLLWEGSRLAGFAVCHWGPATEAGSGVCYVKFGAVRSSAGAGEAFERLLEACEALAQAQGMPRLVAGVNTARHGAYRKMLSRGFRTVVQGVAMHRPNEAGYHRPDVYAIDDWR